MDGVVGILNVGAGDTTLSFDPKNLVERKRAALVVADMLRRGYALLVQVGKKNGEPLYQRARGFDPKTCEYIVAGGPDEVIDIGKGAQSEKLRRGRPPMRRIKASKTRAVSVGRTAGG